MNNPAHPLDEILKNRRTQKILANPESPRPLGPDQESWSKLLLDLVELAGTAPFHYPSHEVHRMDKTLASIVPWRMYLLDEPSCRSLLAEFQQRGINGGKITQMLAVARAMIQVCWLPEPGALGDNELFQGNQRNMEHIAATSAAIQNLLLAATARGIPSYWSSGGKLRDQPFPGLLGIPDTQIPLGYLFLFPPEPEDVEIKPGALRGKGGSVSDWAAWVKWVDGEPGQEPIEV